MIEALQQNDSPIEDILPATIKILSATIKEASSNNKNDKTKNMKRNIIASMALALMCSAPAMAVVDNTFQFVDKSGNVIADGSTVTVKDVTIETEYDEETGKAVGTFPVIYSGISARNTTSAVAYGGMKWTINRIDNGSMQVCFPEQCTVGDKIGEKNNEPGMMEASQTKSIQTEWLPKAAGETEVKLTFTYYSMKEDQWGIPTYTKTGEGSSITVRFVYDGSASVNGIVDDANDRVVARYSAGGALLSGKQKGLNILRYASGKTVKQIVR